MNPPMRGPGGPPPQRGGPRHNDIMGGPPPDRKKEVSGELYAEECDLKQMEQESEEMLRMNYLNQENAVFQKSSGGFLNLIHEGKDYKRVQIIRTFPFSDPDSYLSIREDTEKAKEIGMIKDFHKDFSQDTVAHLEEQLTIRYFSPVIHRILQVKEENGFSYFDVQTDYGQCQFSFRSNSSSVVHLSDTRIVIYDLNNNRYEIPDTTKLTNKELKKLDLFM